MPTKPKLMGNPIHLKKAEVLCNIVSREGRKAPWSATTLKIPNFSSVFFFLCKLSVAVCIGFLVAWSPYAVVSMWAAFGHIDDLPPLAFAMPAMFAKSSTIYNPIIYLMLRPNIRRVLCRDLGTLCHVCLKSCRCTKGPAECCSKPEIRVRLGTIPRQASQIPSSNSFAQPAIVALKDYSCEKCKDAFECFRHYPQICGVTNPAATEDAPKDQHTPDPQIHKQNTQRVYNKKSLLATMCAKRTPEIDNLNINLEMIPGHTKVAWPWYSSQFLIILYSFLHILRQATLCFNCQDLFRNVPHTPTVLSGVCHNEGQFFKLYFRCRDLLEEFSLVWKWKCGSFTQDFTDCFKL